MNNRMSKWQLFSLLSSQFGVGGQIVDVNGVVYQQAHVLSIERANHTGQSFYVKFRQSDNIVQGVHVRTID